MTFSFSLSLSLTANRKWAEMERRGPDAVAEAFLLNTNGEAQEAADEMRRPDGSTRSASFLSNDLIETFAGSCMWNPQKIEEDGDDEPN
jgi:hypothetical protein